jgi:hypothetical protein
VPGECFSRRYTASLQSSAAAVSSARRCISTFFAIVQRSPDCILTSGAFDCRRRERQASSLCTVQPHVQRGGIFRSRTATLLGVQDGCHFRHRDCRTRNLTMLMGNANTCVFLARRSPDILGNGNSIRSSTRYRPRYRLKHRALVVGIPCVSRRTYLRGMDDSSNNDNWRRAMASCKRGAGSRV